MKTRSLANLAVVFALSVPAIARAQSQGPAYLGDRRFSDGGGIRTGNLELHPGIGAEIGYDSNFLNRTHEVPPPGTINSNAPVEESGRLRITPSLSLSTLGPRRLEGQPSEPPPVTFRLTASLSYLEFFGAKVIRDQRNVSAGIKGNMVIGAGRPFGAAVNAGYSRLVLPNATGNPDFAFTQNRPEGGLDLVFTPGRGNLEYRVGYQFAAVLYETTASLGYNSTLHSGHIRGRWRFHPRNSIISEASVGRNLYTNRRPGSTLADSTPISARVGLDGLFTPNLGGTFTVGWGQTYFDKADNPNARDLDTLTATARLTYYLTPNPDSSDAASELSTFLATITAGYTRAFQYSLVTNQLLMDRGELAFNTFFAGRATLNLTAGIAAVQYPEFYLAYAPTTVFRAGSTDVRPDVGLFAEYRFSDSFGVNVTTKYMQNISKVRLPQEATQTQFFDFNFRRFEAFLGARYFL